MLALVRTHKDYYYILGVNPKANTDEIQFAFDELYDKFGPHVSNDSMDADVQARTFKDISAAYEVLMNSQTRREYDRHFSDHVQKSSDVRALWGMVTKHKKSTETTPTKEEQAPQHAAATHNVEIEVSLKEAVKGTHKQIVITDPKPCKNCVEKKPLERMQCKFCRGLGYYNVDRTVDVDLPPGLYDNMQIRKLKQGKYDLRAGKYGDLLLDIKLRQHPVLQVEGKDIKCVVPISICEAVLGAEIQVPTAGGKVSIKIQPLTHQGRTYRLKGLGLAGADMLVVIDVVIPKRLTGEEVKLFKQLHEISTGGNPREALYRKLDQLG
ncbi:MAG: DnaJ domain-containing protein [Cyanobacteria bacterium]|nr:DnaJ domain-containing protein [Cyanobacteriota bacterium]